MLNQFNRLNKCRDEPLSLLHIFQTVFPEFLMSILFSIFILYRMHVISSSIVRKLYKLEKNRGFLGYTES